jgi:nucleotide-binding universal stress UspA family protein
MIRSDPDAVPGPRRETVNRHTNRRRYTVFKTIVLAVDGSESSDRAVAYAGDLARESGGRIVAVHIKEMIAGRFAGPVHVDEAELQAKIRGQIKDLTDAGVSATLEMHSTMTGGPAPVVADTAAREQADVIVAGTRGHTALAGVIVGSVAQRLLHLAPCPVLVVPVGHGRHGQTSERAEQVSAG